METLNDVVYGSVDWKDISVKFHNFHNTRILEMVLKMYLLINAQYLIYNIIYSTKKDLGLKKDCSRKKVQQWKDQHSWLDVVFLRYARGAKGNRIDWGADRGTGLERVL